MTAAWPRRHITAIRWSSWGRRTGRTGWRYAVCSCGYVGTSRSRVRAARNDAVEHRREIIARK